MRKFKQLTGKYRKLGLLLAAAAGAGTCCGQVVSSVRMTAGPTAVEAIRSVIPSSPINATVPLRLPSTPSSVQTGRTPSFSGTIELSGVTALPESYGIGYAQRAAILDEATFAVVSGSNATDASNASAGMDDFGPVVQLGSWKAQIAMGGGDVALTAPASMMHMARKAAASEASLSVVSGNGHFGMRVQGRVLYDPSPYKLYPIVSTVNFYLVGKPTVSAFYRF